MTLKTSSQEKRTLAWVTLFGIGFGFVEAAVVVYLRKLYCPDDVLFPLKVGLSSGVSGVEVGREAATLVMLLAIAGIAGRNFPTRLAYFLYSFAVWDIFYYVWLKVLIGWPASFLTWDILFLIPVVWASPVLAPLLVCVPMIVLAVLVLRFPDAGLRPREGLLLLASAAAFFISFIWDYAGLVFKHHGNSAQLAQAIGAYVPARYRWDLLILGQILAFVAIFLFRAGNRRKTAMQRSTAVPLLYGVISLAVLGGVNSCGLSGDLPTANEDLFYEFQPGQADKPTIVLNHELLYDHTTMKEFADYFSALGYSTLLWDYPGHHASGDFPLSRPYTIQELSKSLREVVTRAGVTRPIVMGFSTGGLVAVDYALNYPDDCRGLILVATAHRGTGALGTYLSSLMDPPASTKRTIPFFIYDVDPRAAVQIGSDILGYDAPANQITRPVVYVIGDRDRFFPMAAAEDLIAQLAPTPFGCRYEIIPGGTHGITYSHTEELERFITENLDYLQPPY